MLDASVREDGEVTSERPVGGKVKPDIPF